MKLRVESLMAPPVGPAPFDPPVASEWRRIERELGTSLPSDYKRFIKVYGSGKVNDFLSILNPFSDHPRIDLVRGSKELGDVYRHLRDVCLEEYPCPVFPEKDGLLAFAGSDNGDTAFWVTSGAPDQWTIRVLASRDPECWDFPGGLDRFLVAVLTEEARCTVFPKDLCNRSPWFVPWPTWPTTQR